MNNLPRRKNIRLKNYDYSQPGYYFITICTRNRRNLLSIISTEGGFHAAPHPKLTPIGNEIVKTIGFINDNYPDVKIDKFIVMPNHIHLIVVLQQLQPGRHRNLPLPKVVGQFKSYTNKMYNDLNGTNNLILWQRNYYEHIIRDTLDYERIYKYIEANPLKWRDDKHYK